MNGAPAATSLRLLSSNIQAGSSTRAYREYVTRSWSHVLHLGKRGNLDSLAELFSTYDVVGLQEADPGSLRSGFDNQSDYLAERARFPFVSHQANRRISGIAGSGNALLSRVEPTELLDYALPGRIAGRGVLLAHFGHESRGLTIAVAHLSLGAQSRASQLAFIAELLHDHPHAVLMGDFNCDVDRPEMQSLFRRTRLQPPDSVVATFPSWRPQRAIDHILIGDGLLRGHARAMPAAQSDHLALSLELDVPETALRR